MVTLAVACQPAPATLPTPLPTSLPTVDNPNPLRATAVASGAILGAPPSAAGELPRTQPAAASPSPRASAAGPAATATAPRRVRPATPTVAPPPGGDRGFKAAALLVDPDKLQRGLSDSRVRVIDARPAEAYAAGHVPGAVSLGPQWLVDLSGQSPTSLLSPEGFKAEVQTDGISTDSEVVVYDDEGGLWAARVLWALNAYGLSRTSLLEGGFRAWQAAGKPVETAPAPTPPEGRFDPQADGRVWVNSTEVSKLLKDPRVVIVDARSEEEYRGKLRLAARAGRLPGAVLHYWRDDLGADGQYFKSAAELEQAYRAIGVTPDKTVIVYCQNGVRAAHVYLALKLLGYPDVRVYDAGWGEWGNLRLPIDTEGS